MKIIITEEQNKRLMERVKSPLIPAVQKIIDHTISSLREESEDWGLGEMDEIEEVQSVDKVVVVSMDKDEESYIVFHVDFYVNHPTRHDYVNVLGAIDHEVSKLVPNSLVYLDDIIREK